MKQIHKVTIMQEGVIFLDKVGSYNYIIRAVCQISIIFFIKKKNIDYET